MMKEQVKTKYCGVCDHKVERRPRNHKVLSSVAISVCQPLDCSCAHRIGTSTGVVSRKQNRERLVYVVRTYSSHPRQINRVYFISLWLIWGNIYRKNERSTKITKAVRHRLFLWTFPFLEIFPHINRKLMK